MDTVYIETSIVSHASAWTSTNPATAVLQDQAKRWLADEAPKYELVTSQFVIDEVSLGDPDAAAKRLELLRDVRVLIPDAEVERVADEIISHSLMPKRARIGCVARSLGRGWRCKIPIDAKLQTYRERNRASEHLRSIRRPWIRSTVDLHAS